MDQLATIAALVVLASLTGVEVAVARFFHPVLDRLSPPARAQGHARSAQTLGSVMPFWYATAIVTAALAAVAAFPRAVFWLWAGCAVSLIAVIVVTIVALVPLNNRVASWRDAPAPEGWEATVERWDALHRRRTVILVIVTVAEFVAAALPS